MSSDDRHTTIYHRAFELGIWLKGVDGVLEMLGGLLLLAVRPSALTHFVMGLTQHELSEDPHDWLANALRALATQLSASTQLLGGLYLIGHGLVKLLIVVAVWRGYRWAYPLAIGFLALFIAYQAYRLSYHPVLWLLILTLFDLAILGLTWREYTSLVKASPHV